MLKGKTAVVTGASRGIGRAIATKFMESGANVAIIYAGSHDAAAEVAALGVQLGVTAREYQCDIGDGDAVRAVCAEIVKDFGTVDILVNNAGITKDNLVMRMSEADFDAVIGVNLRGAFSFIKNLSRPLMKSGAGRVINISSVSGVIGNPGQANYAAAKAGLIGLTKTVAKEYASRNVTCNAIAPGFIATDMTAKLSESVLEAAVGVIPLKRFGQPEDIANLAVFLASDAAAYITGEVIRVDGGMAI